MFSEEDLIKILQKLIKIQTENPNGETKSIVDYITTLFPEKQGFEKEIVTHMKNDIKLHNLIVKLGSGTNKIIFCGHLDTVPAGENKNWNFPPFEGIIMKDKVFGRGSADMKGGIVSIIGIMHSFIDQKEFLEKNTLIFAATADEEAGMTGAETIAPMIMKDANLVIIPEATNLKIGVAEKGVLWIKLKIIGKAAHGSMPHEGINAIEGAMNIIPQLYKNLGKRISNVLGKSTLNIGTIIGGNKINIVPEEVTLELDYRLIPEDQSLEIIENIKSIDPTPCKLEMEIMQNLPALISNKDTKFIQNLQETINNEIIGLTYGTDAAKLIENNKSVPFVIFGPGDNTIIHQTNEFVNISQVIQVTKSIYQALIKTYS
ncbi:MAG: M20 family metallopeptidase [Candidatus Thorarchaeota archaeon]